jgi:hypothetical protein
MIEFCLKEMAFDRLADLHKPSFSVKYQRNNSPTDSEAYL